MSVATATGGVLAWAALLRRQVKEKSAQLLAEMQDRQAAAIEFDAALRERSRLAANLHDTLLQSLAAAVLQLDVCRGSLAGSRVAEATGQLDVAKRMVKHAAADLRSSVWALRTAPAAGGSFRRSVHHGGGRVTTTSSARVTDSVSRSQRGGCQSCTCPNRRSYASSSNATFMIPVISTRLPAAMRLTAA